MEQEVKRLCRYCKEEIHPLRLDILPNTKTCRLCSKEGKKASRFNFTREGEDVQSTLSFHDPEEYQKIVEIESKYKNGK